MLGPGSRLRDGEDFRTVMRGGGRAGSSTMVVYLQQTGDASRMAGLAVSKAVGGAVTRNLVKRRLRAGLAQVLPGLPAGSRVVVRALPAAATTPFAQLTSDVERLSRIALAKAAR